MHTYRLGWLFLCCGVLAVGCEPTPMTDPAVTPPTTTERVPATQPIPDKQATPTDAVPVDPATTDPTTSNGTVLPDSTPAADNTAVNERDADAETKTPLDQSEEEADILRTADIRKRIVAESDLSLNAQNVKVITVNGQVTLRGPVASEEERERIEKIAHDIAGKENVDSQLEVAP